MKIAGIGTLAVILIAILFGCGSPNSPRNAMEEVRTGMLRADVHRLLGPPESAMTRDQWMALMGEKPHSVSAEAFVVKSRSLLAAAFQVVDAWPQADSSGETIKVFYDKNDKALAVITFGSE